MPDRTNQRSARPDETCSCGRPATIVFVFEDAPDVPYCGTPRRAGEGDEDWDAIPQAGAEQEEDGRIADAREAIAAASMAVMSGNLGYDAEQTVERLSDAIDGLLQMLAEQDQ
jgi:hypothetical protein